MQARILRWLGSFDHHWQEIIADVPGTGKLACIPAVIGSHAVE
ncbi:hypothetical protein V473_16015 [Sphingobium cupriresistens LL01]|uniref:Uncharacterized protein n=1 Tax=Sphingobium cupriresistens LL01 TaxID=1420583 RepID=A0A0J7XT12_9SPHN|nr:hypothetical protein V473_16015 [Sphingobium cupriresistens LL01]